MSGAVYVGLLRAVNLGGHGKVGMGPLREMAAARGFESVRSLLNSGNLVFAGKKMSPHAIEKTLESAAAESLNLKTDFFVRTDDEWKAIIAANPFVDEAKKDPAHLVVVCLKDKAGAADVKNLQEAIQGPETVRAEGSTLYAVYPAGIGTSKLTMPVIERHLGCRGTGRNWNTVLKLRELASSIAGK
ncbi:MAG: DUF1697 domain-containing protein [Chloroflexi bacterium]|nr:DUF1697 domain-containing protein [Chloroflexota bacterium]